VGTAAAITALENPAIDCRRLRIWLDEEPWRTTNRRVGRELGLTVGDRVDADHLAGELDEEERRQAKDHALRMLTYRARSRGELERRLRDMGFGESAIAETAGFLASVGYLDDQSFAEQWIAERVRNKQYGRRRIISELAAKGVDPESVAHLLEEYCPEAGEGDRARAIIRRRLAGLSGLDRLAAARRLGPYLLRKGYSSGIVASALRETEDSGDPGDVGHLAGECGSL
jgi:regulatory protein